MSQSLSASILYTVPFDRDALETAFRAAYGSAPAAIIRTPGRVNLIGEHTDYSELPVLPIAIGPSVYVAASSTNDGVITARSSRFQEVGAFGRSAPPRLEGWLRYLAGALAELVDLAPAAGAQLLIESDLPAEGGLSSSSALTVGLLAALSAAWNQPLDRSALLPRAIAAERHTGVESGGMDQEVMLFAEAGCALRIDFRPPRRRSVPIPGGLAFVAAYSGEPAAKGGSARDAYNERVVGARLAAIMLADQLGVGLEFPPTLGQVAGVDVVGLLADALPPRISAREVAHGAGVEIASLVQLSHATFDGAARIPVRPIARHILSEAARVDAAEDALQRGDLRHFGRLLDASHASLRDDFRCSTPALDRLCKAMRGAGALGARLTGAGFGGFAMAACPPSAVPSVIQSAISAGGGPAFEVRASAGYEPR